MRTYLLDDATTAEPPVKLVRLTNIWHESQFNPKRFRFSMATRHDGGTMTTVALTDRAARRIGEILETEPAGSMLRVSVEGGGCSGFQYRFDIEQQKADDDLVLAKDSAVVLVDPVSQQYMAGAVIDYVDDLIGASFKVDNPVAAASCGCGTSFSI
jgi:iron-sulfur cluster assembly accessory protein